MNARKKAGLIITGVSIALLNIAAKFTGEPEIQAEPLSAEETLAHFQLEDRLEIQLVASEPLVTDPVEIAFDERGRMFVVENNGYNRIEDARPRSQIRVLEDVDGDGTMDEGRLFAYDLDYAQGILPVNGGLVVTLRSEVIFLRDSNGNGKADIREVIFSGTRARHIDAQMAAPRRGLNNWIYINGGLGEKEIHRPGDLANKFVVGGNNFRFHPESREVRLEPGIGQFGNTFDDLGRQFFCSNRNPGMFAVMPQGYLERNPPAMLAVGHDDVTPTGAEAQVYPLKRFRTTSSAHAGTFTAACGVSVYRGDALGNEFAGSLFTCEPTAGLIARFVIESDGASFRTRRGQAGKEFLASDDEWFRPVNTCTGPDGSLYVVDMYRRFIDGARFFPDDYAATNDMAAGRDRGRIYRIVAKGKSQRTVAALPEKGTELVALLSHPNGWHRDTAQRLLVESGDASILPELESLLTGGKDSLARLHALWTIEGLGRLEARHVLAALDDREAGLVESGLMLAPLFLVEDKAIESRVLNLSEAKDGRLSFLATLVIGGLPTDHCREALVKAGMRGADDPWMRRAILSSPATRRSPVLAGLLADESFSGTATPGRSRLIGALASVLGAAGEPSEVRRVLEGFEGSRNAEQEKWILIAFADGLDEGLKRQTKGEEGMPRGLAALLAKPPEELKDRLDRVREVLASASQIMMDRGLGQAERLGAILMLSQLPWAEAETIAAELLKSSESSEIQVAALTALTKMSRARVSDFLYRNWPQLGAAARKDAIQYLSRDRLVFLEKVRQGVISPALVDPVTRWVSLNSGSEPIRLLAEELFGAAGGDRKKVVKKYATAIRDAAGSPEKGREIFKTACLICHRFKGEGGDVGPDISDVRIKTAEMLLSDILDPNNAIDPRWEAQVIELTNGRSIAGVVSSGPAGSMLVKGAGFSETVSRSEISSSKPLGVSLMPEGLEGALSEKQLADLLAYLQGR